MPTNGRHDLAYTKIKTLTRKQGGNRGNKVEVKKRWKEYIEKLYKGEDDRCDYKEGEAQSEDDEIMGSRFEWNDFYMGPNASKVEILAAFGEMKNKKGDRIDNI